MKAIIDLSLYSRQSLQHLRADLALEYDQLQKGILHVYSEMEEFEHAVAQSSLMREFGCNRIVKTAEECLAIEPALTSSSVPLVGGTYTAEDESGDALKFTQALAERCVAKGVRFHYEQDIAGLEHYSGKISAVRLANGVRLTADAYVVALGSYSPLFLKPIGVRLPIYPGKGYSATLTLTEDAVAPTVSITDDGHKLVYSRLGNRLRIAGTAEFNGYNTSLNKIRCDALLKRTAALFPDATFEGKPEFWTGLRPATPGNVPFVGKAYFDNLYVDSGHGTLGWTMACGSGRLLADIVSGKAPDVDPAPYRIS